MLHVSVSLPTVALVLLSSVGLIDVFLMGCMCYMTKYNPKGMPVLEPKSGALQLELHKEMSEK